MKSLRYIGLLALFVVSGSLYADNQTLDSSPIFSDTALPFRITIEQMNNQLPFGLHSGVLGRYKNFWIILAGRLNGLHGFTDVGSFPINQQNTTVLLIDIATGQTYSKDLQDASSGLSEEQVDSLSATDAEYYQENNTLYMIGGYGFSRTNHQLITFPILSAMYLPGIVSWVKDNQGSFVENLRQVQNPTFQICGGYLLKIGSVMNIIFGQNFAGEYTSNSNGLYSEQVRRFVIQKSSKDLSVEILPSTPSIPNPNYRRRDFNALPALFPKGSALEYGFVVFSGVFTESGGIWTIPVVLKGNGEPQMASPTSEAVFKQSVNAYSAPSISFYSRKTQDMYNIILGGMTYQYYDGSSLISDLEVPFTNQIAVIKMDKNGYFSQYLMSTQYPTVPSSGGVGYWFFGASAYFLPNAKLSQYPNAVINLDAIRTPTVLGYVVGGIQSNVLNTTDSTIQTAASPYIFKVTLYPVG